MYVFSINFIYIYVCVCVLISPHTKRSPFCLFPYLHYISLSLAAYFLLLVGLHPTAKKLHPYTQPPWLILCRDHSFPTHWE